MEKQIYVTNDRQNCLITFIASGFWDLTTVGDFRQQMATAAAVFSARRQPFDVLADMTDFLPQSQLIANELQDSMLRGVTLGMRRTACLASRQLTRFQFSRIAAYPNFAFFDSQQEAIFWLNDNKCKIDSSKVNAAAK